MDWKFNAERNRVVLSAPPRSTLRLTATRLGSVLDMNAWQTAFSAWCEITKVYKRPFEETKYTLAGKAIEPIIIDYLRDYFEIGVVSPEDFFGNRYKEVKYNFYPDVKVFGGMWDAKVINHRRESVAVIEIKTSSRPQDWFDGVPDEKLVQALMYAHLEKARTTYVVVAFLEEDDYAHPELFVPVEGKNLKVIPFDTETTKVMFHGEPCTISELMAYATQWWDAYVKTGISPEFDEDRDAEILKELRTQRPDEADSSLGELIITLEGLQSEVERARIKVGLDVMEKQLDNAKKALKREMEKLLAPDSDKLVIGSWQLAKTITESVDKDRLIEDGLYDAYKKTSVSMRLTQKKGEK